jgi:hypothetical protein
MRWNGFRAVAKEEEMKKLRLTAEELRVESFPVEDLAGDERGTVQALVTTLPRTCPECPPTRGGITCP